MRCSTGCSASSCMSCATLQPLGEPTTAHSEGRVPARSFVGMTGTPQSTSLDNGHHTILTFPIHEFSLYSCSFLGILGLQPIFLGLRRCPDFAQYTGRGS